MSEIIFPIVGALTFVIFIAMAYIIMKEKADINFTFIAAALGWYVLAVILWLVTGTGNDPFTLMVKIFHEGPLTFASLTVWYLMTSIMGQCLVKTGVTDYIIVKATELGGGKPYIATPLILFAVAYIFMGVGYNAGIFIVIATICLPILQTYGFDRYDSAFLVNTAVYSGYIIALSTWVGRLVYFPKMTGTMSEWTPLFYVEIALMCAVFVIYGTVRLWQMRRRRSWSVNAASPVAMRKPEVPWYSIFGPVIPVLLVMYANWPIIPAVLVGAFYPFITTQVRAKRTLKELTSLWWSAVLDGFRDVTTVLMLFYTISMIMTAAEQPQIVAALKPIWGVILPREILLLMIMMTVLVPLELYRGFIDPLGAGAALLASLRALGDFTDNILYVTFRGQATSHNWADPTHSGNVWLQGAQGIDWKKYMRRYYPIIWGVAAIRMLWGYICLIGGLVPLGK
jgi:predicted histidine transporter YuiF (NhaC family)